MATDSGVSWKDWLVDASEPRYYREDLALVHDRGFGFHAAACAAGIIAFLEPVRYSGGIVLELGCGSGLLTRELVEAGHRVIATDASPAMLKLAKERLAEAALEIHQLALPDDPLPPADAIVAVGHPLNYLPDAASIQRALVAIAHALNPGGRLALDMCDLEWGRARTDAANLGRAGPDWAIITEFSTPTPDRFVRDMTTFIPNPDGSWRRDSEHHENTLIDTASIPDLLKPHGIDARVATAFGQETLPVGLHVITGTRCT
jgi:SAM-dependent methyltransferase